MTSNAVPVEAGKHGGPPSDKPWTPPQEPKPSPDGSRSKFAPQS